MAAQIFDETGWTTQLFTFQEDNPEFNTISEENLKDMLSDPLTAEFALGLYFDGVVDRDLQTVYRLKPQIILSTDKPHRFLTESPVELASVAAQQLRDRRYDRMVRRFPDRPRIVAIGDSWFNHPTETDLVDQLSKLYPIHFVPIQNNNADKQPYLEAVQESRANFLLVSMRLFSTIDKRLFSQNTIRDALRKFLDSSGYDSYRFQKDPDRYLSNEFYNKLDLIASSWNGVFNDTRTANPPIHILIHGYDYIVPGFKAQNPFWQLIMEVVRSYNTKEQQALFRHVIDTLNKRLKVEAAECPNVSYIDLRNTVQPDQWLDELHPNSAGFEQIANKFITRINELTARKPA
ncbi:hypothetical protein ACS5NO_04390 [Larkinella sp. GY13]|uniref:hypothetical protein n=1 Tax=Larkinella sp. GY13 TaxID=3453720 RepID=UPI003EED5B44